MLHFTVPTIRVRLLNGHSADSSGDFVLYWMTAFRRVHWNFALQQARDWAIELKRPLLILEALRCDYRWASDRFHRFVIEGMLDNRAAIEDANIMYYPYVEPHLHAGKGLVRRLAARACVLVADDFPCFFHPGMYQRLADKLRCRFELVDSNCLMPLAAAERTFTVAHSYRRWMQKTLPEHLAHSPEPNPLAKSKTKHIPPLQNFSLFRASSSSADLNGGLPSNGGLAAPSMEIFRAFPQAELEKLLKPGGLDLLPIDHTIGSVDATQKDSSNRAAKGGTKAAESLLKRFLDDRLAKYDHDRNEPDEQGASELSAHLHFGHISAHEIFWQLMESQRWNLGRVSKPNGKVSGYWQVDANVEAYLDQLCTWREIGFNMCWREADYDQYASLPDWAQKTLADHADDKRPWLYDSQQLEEARTHDPIWNAAQRQLRLEGRIHNYLRMLWGKKILHWSCSPQQALDTMIELNNKYALDGRDPNSYSGIFWVLGRYDRAWGPERSVFGKIRYMTSENTAKKHALNDYLKRYNSLE